MAITSLHVAGYRSVREVRLALDRVNVPVGPNGCGKTNLYRALYRLAATAAELPESLVCIIARILRISANRARVAVRPFW